MASKITNNIYLPSDQFHYMFIKNIVWGSLGLLLGICVNNLVVYLSNTLKINYLFIQNILQIIFCALILALIHTYFNYFGWTWQATTPGFIFVSFFFGVQFKIMSNIQSTFILKDMY